MNPRMRTMYWTSLRRLRLPALFAVLCITSGCAAGGAVQVSTGQSFGPTVAFESVDGPPPQVFDKLVRALEAESTARSFTIVSREALTQPKHARPTCRHFRTRSSLKKCVEHEMQGS